MPGYPDVIRHNHKLKPDTLPVTVTRHVPKLYYVGTFLYDKGPYVYFYNIPAYAGICKIPCPVTSEHGQDMGHWDTRYPRVLGADGIWDIRTQDPVGTITQP